MSGHNKWSTIKQKKGKNDAARAKVFTKIGRELIVAIKTGGSADPNVNSKLKDTIAKAKAANVPNDNIERIIKKAANDNDATNYEAVTYEGYGPSGVAVIVEALTDNRNRTAGEVRHYFDKFGGNMGTQGCVSFMFSQKGVLVMALPILRRTRTSLPSTPSRRTSAPCATSSKSSATPSLRRSWKWYPAPTPSSTTRTPPSKCRKCSTCLRIMTISRMSGTTGKAKCKCIILNA